MGRFDGSTRFGLAFVALCLALLFSLGAKAHGATLHVTQSGDGTDGLSWETAFNTITAAVVTAATGDVIHISAETYVENITLATSVPLLGGFDTLEGSEMRSTRKGLTSKTIVDGNQAGSVFRIISVSVTIENVIVSNGIAAEGAGIFIEDATVALRGVTVTQCSAVDEQGGGVGGGIRADNSVLTVLECKIEANQAGTTGMLAGNLQGAGGGGGIYITGGETRIGGSVFLENTAHPGWFRTGSDVRGIPSLGGGLYIGGGNTWIENIICNDNNATNGDGMRISLSDEDRINIINSTLISEFGEVLYWSRRGPVIVNSIVVGTDNPIYHSPFAEETDIRFCNIQGGHPGEGNIDADPLFVDPENGDFHLQASSPCIDSASTTGPATDLDGNPRPFDVPSQGRDGTGDEYDMGAYEFIIAPTPVPTFNNPRSDINESGEVDALDLLILLGDWMKTTGVGG